jgi:hypothetical protein
MRAIHEHDCAQHTVGVCTCGAFLKCSRMGGGMVPGLAEHEANLKKLRVLLESEKAAAIAPTALPADGVQSSDPATGAGPGTTAV